MDAIKGSELIKLLKTCDAIGGELPLENPASVVSEDHVHLVRITGPGEKDLMCKSMRLAIRDPGALATAITPSVMYTHALDYEYMNADGMLTLNGSDGSTVSTRVNIATYDCKVAPFDREVRVPGIDVKALKDVLGRASKADTWTRWSDPQIRFLPDGNGGLRYQFKLKGNWVQGPVKRDTDRPTEMLEPTYSATYNPKKLKAVISTVKADELMFTSATNHPLILKWTDGPFEYEYFIAPIIHEDPNDWSDWPE